MEREKKGLLILGYDANEKNWKETVWGTPPRKAGRLVKGAAIILEEDIDLAIISSDGGWREGKSEAKLMKERLYDGLKELEEFTVYPVLQEFSSEEIKEKLDECLVLEEEAQNTVQSITQTGPMFRKKSITKVILTTSPDHISRAIRDALNHWERDFPELAANVWATPSITPYSGKVSNVVIVERPVMKKFNLARIFKILKKILQLFQNWTIY